MRKLKSDVRRFAFVPRLCAFAISVVLCSVFVGPEHPKAADANHQSDSCVSLKNFQAVGLDITDARLIAAGPAPGSKAAIEDETTLPEHCLVRGVISRRTGVDGKEYGIGFELRMPTDWNGRFLFEGGGYMDGVSWLAYGSLFGRLSPVALARGFAVVRTDSGHLNSKSGATGASFSLDQQARLDFGFNALDKVTLQAKALVRAYYGRRPDRAYFMGCSNGGRQAMLMAERFPEYFDGIIAGDPSFNITHLSIWLTWNQKVLAKIAPKDASGRPILSRAFSDDDLKLVSRAVVAQCDKKDGLADGMINDVAACDFDPSVLACKGPSKQPDCLSRDQVAAMKQVFEGPKDAVGKPLFPPFPYDTGISTTWRGTHLGTSDSSDANSMEATIGLDTLRYYSLTPPDLDLKPQDLDVEKAWKQVRQTAAMNDADWTFMNSFAAHGKLILYQGNSDYGLSAKGLAAWYEKAGHDTGGHIQDWARLFLVPGMGHCSGGMATDEFDPLTALVDWVERGQVPDRIVAKGKQFPGLSRPLCPWPKVARYKGGPTSSADSFVCE